MKRDFTHPSHSGSINQGRARMLADAACVTAVLTLNRFVTTPDWSSLLLGIFSDGFVVAVLSFVADTWGARKPLLGMASRICTALAITLSFMDALSYHFVGAPLHWNTLATCIRNASIISSNLDMLSPEIHFKLVGCVALHLVAILTFRFVVARYLRRATLPSRRSAKVTAFIFFFAFCVIMFTLPTSVMTGNVAVRLVYEKLAQLWQGRSQLRAFISEEALHFAAERSRLHRAINASRKRSVFVIQLESVRAKALYPWNADIPEALTPFLSQLVKSGEARVVENMFSSVPNTMKSLFTTMCGIPAHMGPEWLEYQQSSFNKRFCLPHLLGDLGWSTGFFTSSTLGLQSKLGFERAYGGHTIAREIDSSNGRNPYRKANYLGWDERITLRPFIEWLQASKREAFAVISTLSTHAPYTIANSSRARNGAFVARKAAAASFTGHKAYARDYENYLLALLDTDDFIRSLYDAINSSHQGLDATVIIMGDHGEGFGEHTGSYFHAGLTWDEVVRVPMLIIDRKQRVIAEEEPGKGGTTNRIPGMFDSRDIRRTIFEMAGFEPSLLDSSTGVPSSMMRPPRNIVADQTDAVPHLSSYCDVITASLVDTEEMSCYLGNGLKFMQRPNKRLIRYNLSSDPLEKDGFDAGGSDNPLRRKILAELAEFRRYGLLRHASSTSTEHHEEELTPEEICPFEKCCFVQITGMCHGAPEMSNTKWFDDSTRGGPASPTASMCAERKASWEMTCAMTKQHKKKRKVRAKFSTLASSTVPLISV